MRIVVAVHDPPVWTIPEADVRRLAESLSEDVLVDARTPEDRLREFSEADVILTTRLTPQEFRSAGRVRWIQSSAVGVGGLLVEDLVASDVLVTNARGLHADRIAEHALTLTLALRRRLHVSASRQHTRRWAQQELMQVRVPALADSTMLVVGLGSIGGRVATLASAIGMKVIGVRRRPDLASPPGVTRVVGPDQLKEVLGLADAVVLAAPRTVETRALIGRDELAAMRAGAVLVNVARGRLINESALVVALGAGRLAGAGLDAFEHEPLPSDHPLWGLPNVLITPHTAAFGGDYWAPVVDLFRENLARFRRGEPLLNLVDKNRGY